MSEDPAPAFPTAATAGGFLYGAFTSWFADYVLGAPELEGPGPGTLLAIVALGLIVFLLACLVRAFLMQKGSGAFKAATFAMILGYAGMAGASYLGLTGS